MRQRKTAIIETLAFSLVLFAVSYLIDRSAPLFMRNEIHYTIIFLAIVTLYYGTVAGLVATGTFAVLMLFVIHPFPYQFLLENLIFALLFGEFHFFWSRRISTLKEEKQYLEERLRELGKAFFALKISTDQIEKSYVLKPVSIRSLLNEARDLFILHDVRELEHLLKLFATFFSLDTASLYLLRNGRYERAAGLGAEVPLDENDALVKKAVETGNAAFINTSELKEGRNFPYLAVIPGDGGRREKPDALLLVKEMPFMAFNKDNILMMNVVLSYFMDMTAAAERAAPHLAKFPFWPVEFTAEIIRLAELKKRFGLESTLTLFRAHDQNVKDSAGALIESKIRSIDMFCRIPADGGKEDAFIVLLPMVGEAGATGFIERIRKTLATGLTARIITLDGVDDLSAKINSLTAGERTAG